VPRIGEAPRHLPDLLMAARQRLNAVAGPPAVAMLTAGDA